MKMHVLTTIAVILSLAAASYADRVMSRTEALGILQKLASTPTSTWITAGTIDATHGEYGAPKTTDSAAIDAAIQQKISDYQANPNKIEKTPELQKMALEAIPFNVRYEMNNEYTMNSSVTVKYDGSRFYWSIKVSSRTDSMSVTSDVKGNYATRQFKMGWNGNRIFAWDGQKYTLYMASANQAIIDAAGTVPHNVNGPLTAGIIPWGYGSLTSSSLSNATIASNEVTRSSQTQVQMTVQPSDGSIMTFTLDPTKDYAVIAYTWRGKLNRTTSNQYSGYQKIGGKWVPKTIVVEQHDYDTDRLLRSDTWNFTQVNPTIPRDFSVPFNSGTRIEYYSPASTQSAVYTYSNTMNVDSLLAEQIAFNVAKDTSRQNCATAALKYVASSFGKSISDKDLSRLVGSDGKTSLEVLRQTAQGLGIYARAVKIDLATLRTLDNCKAVLHIPGKNHFVVLDSISGPDAWLIDLSSEKFYYRTSADLLPLDWSGGTTLLLSAQPIRGTFHDLDVSASNTITGGDDGWACTELLSGRALIPCEQHDPGSDCYGYYAWYSPRYGCDTAPTGTCYNQDMPWFMECPCIPEIDPRGCIGNGEWETYDIYACR
jgi:LysM repeat protein